MPRSEKYRVNRYHLKVLDMLGRPGNRCKNYSQAHSNGEVLKSLSSIRFFQKETLQQEPKDRNRNKNQRATIGYEYPRYSSMSVYQGEALVSQKVPLHLKNGNFIPCTVLSQSGVMLMLKDAGFQLGLMTLTAKR